jgi:hypothetical protein
MSSNYQEHPEWFTEIMEPFMTPAERAVHEEMIRDAQRAASLRHPLIEAALSKLVAQQKEGK